MDYQWMIIFSFRFRPHYAVDIWKCNFISMVRLIRQDNWAFWKCTANLKKLKIQTLYLRPLPSIAFRNSLLRIILREVNAHALENGGFFFMAGPRQRGKSSFSWKRLWLPIIFFYCFELNSRFLYVKEIWANSQCWAKNSRWKREFSKQSWL